MLFAFEYRTNYWRWVFYTPIRHWYNM